MVMTIAGVRPVDTTDGFALEERYNRLVELAPDAILIHDGETVIMVNAAALVLAGAAERRQMVGRPVDLFLHPPHLKGLEMRIADPDYLGPILPVHDTFTRLDGSVLQVEVTTIPFVERGRPSAHLVIRDITQLLANQESARELDERIHQAERMEAVGLLAGGVAHEVNNMMVVVLGFSDLMLKDARLPADLLEDLRQIRNAGDRASMVTSQLLAFSQRAFRHASPTDLDRVVRDIGPTLVHLLGAEMKLCFSLDCTDPILIDRVQLEQVLVNLATNARDAMTSGGVLRLVTSTVTVGPGTVGHADVAIPPGRYGLIRVEDTGRGMTPDILQRIFEPFFTTKTIGRGTGLGLAAVFGIVRQNNGYVKVESVVGKGTTFLVYLALAEQRIEPEWRRSDRRKHGDAEMRACILVVDDEPAVRAISARILQREGYQVLQASDGRAALELMEKQGPPALVLTDVMMPGMGGDELARRIKEGYPGLPVIFMSGYSADDPRWQGFEGIASVLQKPFFPDVLTHMVAAALAPHRAAPTVNSG
jgi:PAS domain S-box-containing protein